ncbi:acyl carrier protein phosphodiesterase [Jiulongibacter sp. NS-SX5]|uniref:acyl carrier protein phosphodiesterase n=1 Tax=Jiulongibacter sp. NS-SX5 TaxID=3463854 RepID=UPI0040588150
MNYLAHVFLSGSDEEILFGNMLEDFMHGTVNHPRNNHLSDQIKKGIRLHRLIDSYTDSHPIVLESKKVFYPVVSRYASVAVDVIYDHFLIKNWSTFTDRNFDELRKDVYQKLVKYEPLMPERLKKVVSSMIEHDWLKAYEFDYGLERAFLSLNRRIKNGPDMTNCIQAMHENYDLLNEHFLVFFDLLQKECNAFIEN